MIVLRVYVAVPQIVGCFREGVGLKCVRLAGSIELQEPKLVEVRYEDEAILLQVA
jgi:hypothetical protein